MTAHVVFDAVYDLDRRRGVDKVIGTDLDR